MKAFADLVENKNPPPPTKEGSTSRLARTKSLLGQKPTMPLATGTARSTATMSDFGQVNHSFADFLRQGPPQTNNTTTHHPFPRPEHDLFGGLDNPPPPHPHANPFHDLTFQRATKSRQSSPSRHSRRGHRRSHRSRTPWGGDDQYSDSGSSRSSRSSRSRRSRGPPIDEERLRRIVKEIAKEYNNEELKNIMFDDALEKLKARGFSGTEFDEKKDMKLLDYRKYDLELKQSLEQNRQKMQSYVSLFTFLFSQGTKAAGINVVRTPRLKPYMDEALKRGEFNEIFDQMAPYLTNTVFENPVLSLAARFVQVLGRAHDDEIDAEMNGDDEQSANDTEEDEEFSSTSRSYHSSKRSKTPTSKSRSHTHTSSSASASTSASVSSSASKASLNIPLPPKRNVTSTEKNETSST